MELYVEHGFEQTTVAEIAERAGLTERTFFRHFADKREVLFFGQEALLELFVSSVAQAPEGTAPFEMAAAALHAVSGVFEDRRPWSLERQRVISANPALAEREQSKMARLSEAVGTALRDRNISEPTASLTASSCISVFHIAFQTWIAEDNTRGFPQIVTETLDALKAVTAGA